MGTYRIAVARINTDYAEGWQSSCQRIVIGKCPGICTGQEAAAERFHMIVTVPPVPVNAPVTLIKSLLTLIGFAASNVNDANEPDCNVRPPTVSVSVVFEKILLVTEPPGEIVPDRLTPAVIVPFPPSVAAANGVGTWNSGWNIDIGGRVSIPFTNNVPALTVVVPL